MKVVSKRFTDVVSYPAEHVVNLRVYDAIGSRMHTHPWWRKLTAPDDLRDQLITEVLAAVGKSQ